MSEWIRNTLQFVTTLPVVEFPFDRLPEIYAPERTVLKLPDGKRVQPYLWCHLQKRRFKSHSEFNPASRSPARIAALPNVLDRLSKWFRFWSARPSSITTDFIFMSQFLSWADAAEHDGKFELVFTNAELALEAIKGHHSYLRQLLQAHQLAHCTAAGRDHRVIKMLSEIHDRIFENEIEPLADPGTGVGTDAPQEAAVAHFLSTMQAIFDSAARLILSAGDQATDELNGRRMIRLSVMDDSRTTTLQANYSFVRLMELACVAFAGLAIGDSGANLAQIRAFKEPEDLAEQLARPDRIGLTERVIKFRARGKPVAVHLTSITLSRLRTYLDIRDRLVAHFNCDDALPMFIQCLYAGVHQGELGRCTPVSLKALDEIFLVQLRNKVATIGGTLPPITLRQLRAYKQQHLVRKHGVKVAAEAMGHSVATAISAYCKTQEIVRQREMGQFLASLASTVLERSSALLDVSRIVGIAAGSCAEHGKPKAIDIQPLINPDCTRTEGCFFCVQYRVHADETDLRKVLSCRYVLQRLSPLQGESVSAGRIYIAVLDRIDALLAEIRRRIPQSYPQIEYDVLMAGNLSCYWTIKLQQLHLLGMLNPTG